MKNASMIPAACAAWLALAPCAALADEEVVIATGDEGSASDAVLDGYPALAPLDGVGDFGGNALAVALMAGVTEERAMVELPLAPLGGWTAEDVVSAVLAFNIDDVLASFGPGTGFDGTAASSIEVHAYEGDGAVTLADFARKAPEPLAVVDTGLHGVITDSLLASAGPLFFEVDAGDAVRAALDRGAGHLGFLFATTDAGSGTSIDDLGIGAGGPAGVGGAALPFLTVRLAGVATTTTSSSTTSTTLTAGHACGDANEDAKVTAADALWILRAAVAGGACALAACDADGNGKVSAGDALRVLRVAVGAGSTLECP